MNTESVFSHRVITFFSFVLVFVLAYAAIVGEKEKEKMRLENSAGYSGLSLHTDGASALFSADNFARIPDPEISAHAYLVRLMGSERPLMQRRGEKPLPPASITKILTALIAFDRLEDNEEVFFSFSSKTSSKPDEKMSGISAGEMLLRDDAIRAALIPSANDAASAIAETIGKKLGGSAPEERIRTFVGLMNEKAEDIGMMRSHFVNPHGLDAPAPEGCDLPDSEQKKNDENDSRLECNTAKEGNRTTAKDLARLAEYIWYARPLIWSILREHNATVFTNEKRAYTFLTTNELLKEFPGLLGGKTGFTDNAKGTLVLIYPVRTGDIAIIVLLGSEDRFGDGRKIIQWLDNAFETLR